MRPAVDRRSLSTGIVCLLLSAVLLLPSHHALVTKPCAVRSHIPSTALSMRLRKSSNSENDESRRSKRHARGVRKWGSLLPSPSVGRLPLLSLGSKAAKEDDDDEPDEKDVEKSLVDPVLERWEASVTMIKTSWETLRTKLPPPALQLVDVCQAIVDKIFSLRWQVVSFTAGAFLTVAAIVVPIYSEVESLSKPVTLFETILGDLEQAYVDPVDTDKLFETGMAAMLRSLDPYTEYESAQDATDLTESIDGRYAGVGLVIAGNPAARSDTITSPKLLPAAALEDAEKLEDGDMSTSSSSNAGAAVVEEEEELDDFAIQQNKELSKVRKNGIRIVNAFEGYAFDYGLRVGDKLVAIDDRSFTEDTTVESVRNQLRGEPGTLVSLSIERVGVPGVQTVTMPRQIVRIRDVKLATLVGNPSDGVGYIQLSGFASDAGREVRSAVAYLQRAAEDATDGERSLQGLILDMRGNPGGLLTSAVDVASLLVPKGSDIVSAKGRGFPGILYRSRVDPILGSNTKLAVLVNGGTASAAEIVSGAVQDLDAGIIVGSDRTFGKGLVQNVEELPFNSALKFTVAKYYTPSGRCIQGINYKEGGGRGEEDAGYVASKVLEKDRTTYYTRLGRAVRDGGGVEADFKVEAPKASALEITLLRSGLLSDFAAEWSKNNELGNNFRVDDEMYRNFQAFVTDKQKQGDIKLEALYGKSLSDLKTSLKRSGYKGSEKVLENLQTSIIRDIHRDFDKYSSDIKEDISVSILARYVPESHLIERGLKTDKQVQAAVKLVANGNQFDTLLAAGNNKDGKVGHDTLNAYASPDGSERLSGKVKW